MLFVFWRINLKKELWAVSDRRKMDPLKDRHRRFAGKRLISESRPRKRQTP